MAFNTTNNRKLKAQGAGPMATMPVPTGQTGNGAPGFLYEEKSALFLLATNSFFSQKKFYESAADADKRFVDLVKSITKSDPAWMLAFITWLRGDGNMRSSAVVASMEAALVAKGFKLAQPPNGIGLARQLAQAGIGRADEVGEAMAYLSSRHKGKQIPKPIKRGLADALTRHFSEYTALKYGSANSTKEFTPDRLINLLHPTPKAPWQSDLFGYLVARKYGEVEIPESLNMLRKRNQLMGLPVDQRRQVIADPNAAERLKAAGMTWEALAGWLQGPMDAQAWEAIIPNMGYMALLRNLRNFDQAGISSRSAAYVMGKLADEAEVAKAKQFPFRFLAALTNAPNLRWSGALTLAMDASLRNIPTLVGRTLVLVDTSGSMDVPFSEHSEMKRWDAAALFGIALAVRNPGVDVVSYSNVGREFQVRHGADVLGELARWKRERYNQNGGTNTFGVLGQYYRNHDRVIILTDEQANYGTNTIVPIANQGKHVFTFNLDGLRFGHAPTGKFIHSFGGLTDACFGLISMIEEGTAGRWPWEQGK